MRRLSLLLLLAALPLVARAQHHDHAATPDAPVTFAATGFRVDAAALPAGSGVARAGIRWPDGGYATVVYGRPHVRGRVVFGGLVPWDTVWVAGAHRATELWTTVPLRVGGRVLAPGGYALFVTPHRDAPWTVHINHGLGMHLADDFDAAHDVATASATPATLDAPADALTWAFSDDGSTLVLRWDSTELSLPIERVSR